MNSLESAVLRIIGENVSSPDVFSDISPIRRSVNAAIRDLCAITGTYVRTYHLPLRADKQFYRLSTKLGEVLYISSIYDREAGRWLEPISLESLRSYDTRWMESQGPLELFSNVGFGVVGFWRVPSSDRIVEMQCVCTPEDYTSDSPQAIHLPTSYRQAAVSMAVSDYYASRGDATRAGEFLTKALESGKLMSLRPSLQDRNTWRGDNRNGTDKPV